MKDTTPSMIPLPIEPAEEARSMIHDADWQLAKSNLTASQHRIWLGQQLAPESPLYNMIMTFRIDGPLDAARFRDAFHDVVNGSDAMRSVIHVLEGIPFQHEIKRIEDSLEVIDLSALTDGDRELQRWITAHQTRRFASGELMFESALFRIRDDEFVWYLNQHHLITDAWSTAILYRRVADRYHELPDSHESNTDPIPQYREFVEYERSLRIAPRTARIRDFWNRQAKTRPRVSSIYGRRVVRRSSRTARLTLDIGSERSHRLKQLASNPVARSLTPDLTGLNFFLTLMTAWLARVSGQVSVAIGTMTHNRSTAGFRNTIGLFVELFPVGVEVNGDDTFLSLLRRVQGASLGVLSNVQPGASALTGRQPFNTVLNYITTSFGGFAGLPVESTWIHAGHGDPDHLLRLQVHDLSEEQSLTLHFDFNVELFDAMQRQWAVDQFTALLDAFLNNLEIKIHSVPVAGPDEQSRLTTLSQSREPLATTDNVIDLMCHHARRSSASIALECADRAMTYDEFDRRTDSLSAQLQDRGVGDGSHVAICMNRSLEMVVAVYAVLKSGAAFVPLETELPPERVRHVLDDAHCTVILTDREHQPHFATFAIDLMCVDAAVADSIDRIDPQSGSRMPLRSDQPAYVMYTSGSTGRSKGVVVEHGALAHYVQWACREYTADQPTDFPLFSSFGFDLTVTSLFVPLASGGRIVVYPAHQQTAHADLSVIDVFNDDRVDVVKLTPSHLQLIQQMDLSKSRIQRLVVGGENFRTDLARTIHSAFGGNVEIINEYGPTEATVACMIHRFDPKTDTDSSVPIGRPAAHASIYVLDRSNTPAPVGVVGEICVGGPGLAREYLNQSEFTAERFVVHSLIAPTRIYRTGDAGRWRPDGILEFLGRLDRQIKINGIRIEPGEIEAALTQHSEIEASVVDAVSRRFEHSHYDQARLCAKCGIPSSHPDVLIGEDDVCNLCKLFADWKDAADRYFRSIDELRGLLLRGRAADPHAKYDCLMMLSGGKDSTYALYRIVEMGFRPFVFSLDNGYISEQAKGNMRRVVDDLGLDFELASTPAMNEIFVDSLKRFSNVCNGCFKTIYTLSANIAAQLGISIIVTGLSRGQIFETRLSELFRNNVLDPEAVDRGIVEARKAYHRSNDAVSRLLNTDVFDDDNVFEKIQFIDFYRYCDVELQEMQKFLAERAPWVRPDDTGRSTNCLINIAGIFVHQRDRGYHNYAAPYAWDVRLNHKQRDEAIRELDDEIDLNAVETILRDINYDTDWREHDETSRRLVAWYAARQRIDSATLKAHLLRTMPSYMVPTHFVHIDSLPLTANGKIDRAALPAPIASAETDQRNFLGPRTETERTLVRVWEKVFGHKPIGVHDNFFDLGGDSILNIQIIAAADRAGLAITSAALFEHPTIAELAAIIARSQPPTEFRQNPSASEDRYSLSGLSAESLGRLANRLAASLDDSEVSE